MLKGGVEALNSLLVVVGTLKDIKSLGGSVEQRGEVGLVKADGNNGDSGGEESANIGVVGDDVNNSLDLGGGISVREGVVGLGGSNTLDNVVGDRGDDGVSSGLDDSGESGDGESGSDGNHC